MAPGAVRRAAIQIAAREQRIPLAHDGYVIAAAIRPFIAQCHASNGRGSPVITSGPSAVSAAVDADDGGAGARSLAALGPRQQAEATFKLFSCPVRKLAGLCEPVATTSTADSSLRL